MAYLRRQEPFQGDLPDVKPGDRVWCRTAFGGWVRRVATSGPRYDHANAAGPSVWMTVATTSLVEWGCDGERAESVNWPAEDVRPDSPQPPGE